MAIHEADSRAHGGSVGVRDQGLRESALARSWQIVAYSEITLPRLATAYAFGLAKNQPSSMAPSVRLGRVCTFSKSMEAVTARRPTS